jgi:pilus assembly protein Flp/PilA
MLRIYCWAMARVHSLKNERGATAVEYGVMVALIAAVIIATVTLLGQQLVTVFQGIIDALTGV